MKKTLSLFLAFLLLALGAPLTAFAEKDPVSEIVLDSQGAYLINLESDTVLYSKAENARTFPSSLTQIMTALVILQECKEPSSETVTVKSVAEFEYIRERNGVYMMELKIGETFTVYDLLAFTLLGSYCDAAELLAKHFGDGDVSKFVQKMNMAANKLSLGDSHFENPHGLHHPNHYSSPRDTAVILREAMKNPTFREIISLRKHTVPATEQFEERVVTSSVKCYREGNKYHLPCFVGGKSGYNSNSGQCLATYSEQEGVSYISVLIGANLEGIKNYTGNMAEIETNTLLSYAYENFTLKTIFPKGREVTKLAVKDSDKKISVVAKEPILALVRNDAEPTYKLNLPKEIEVEDVKNGKRVGSLHLTFNSVESKKSNPLIISWDGKPITTKSSLEKGAEGAAKAVTNIFTEDKTFVILFICLLLVMMLTLPLLHLADYLQKRKIQKPKH